MPTGLSMIVLLTMESWAYSISAFKGRLFAMQAGKTASVLECDFGAEGFFGDFFMKLFYL